MVVGLGGLFSGTPILSDQNRSTQPSIILVVKKRKPAIRSGLQHHSVAGQAITQFTDAQ